MNREFIITSKEDELIIIKYLLDIMIENNILSEQEYHTVLFKYSLG